MHTDDDLTVAIARDSESTAVGSENDNGYSNINNSFSVDSLLLEPSTSDHESSAQTIAGDSDNDLEQFQLRPRTSDSQQTLEQEVVSEPQKSSTTIELSSPGTQRKPSIAKSLKPWTLEICSAAFSVVTLFAFWPTLSLHAGQPLPRWPLSISINTLLSVFALVLKTNLVFIVTSCIGQSQWSWFRSSPAKGKPLSDLVHYHNASNGAFGSLRWLVPSGPHFNIYQPLATIGALLTILALPIDPFVQQLVTQTDCSESIRTLNATLPRTNLMSISDSTGLVANQTRLKTQFYPSIMSAFYTTVPELTDFECAGGNCSFPGNFSTLGFCSSCKDITQTLSYTEDCITRQYDLTTSTEMAVCKSALIPPDNEDSLGPMFPQYCDTLSQQNISMNLTLATRYDPISSTTSSLNYAASGLFSGNKSLCGHNQTQWQLLGGFSPGYMGYSCDSSGCTADMGDLKFLYSNWGQRMLTSPDECNNTEESWYCNGYGGTSCRFRPCIQTYTASVEAGTLSEVLVEQSDVDVSWPLSSGGNFSSEIGLWNYLSLVDLSLVGNDLQKELLSAGYDDIGTDRWMGFNLTQDPLHDFNESLQKSLLDTGALFVLEYSFHSAMVVFLGSAIDGTTYGDTGSTLSQLFINETALSAKTIEDTMENIAKAITIAIRSNGASVYSDPALGVVHTSAVCVQVNWKWIAFPAILGALTICLLVFTIVDTVRHDLPVWKSFALTMLFNGPPGKEWVDESLITGSSDTGILLERTGLQEGMEKLAEKVSVRLIKGDNGRHRLVQVMSTSR